jgi:hypothetical protein
MDSVKLHEWVARYNWDDGLAPIWGIVESQKTEFATALMIYWLLGGPDLESTPGSVTWEAKQLQNLVRTQLLSDYYARGSCTFAPELSRVHLYQFRKAGVPELLMRAVGPGA